MDDIREADVIHREAYQEFVIFEARPWYQQHLGRLYAFWDKWNQDYFDDSLVTPYVLFAEPSSPQRLGDYARVSGFGGHGQVRLRPSLLTGSHPSVRAGDKYAEGRFLFVADVFLHETVHQWQHEILGDLEDGYHGHGPKFRDQCNRIGALLGLPPVRTSKARGKDKHLPSCAYWPHCVRPADYYKGAYLVERQKEEKGGEPATVSLEMAWKMADSEERSSFTTSHWLELVAAATGTSPMLVHG